MLALQTGCSQPTRDSDKQKNTPLKSQNFYRQDLQSQARIILYDEYGDKRSECVGTYIDSTIVAVPLSAVRLSASAHLSPIGKKTIYGVSGYVAYDFASDIALLLVGHKQKERSMLVADSLSTDSLFCISERSGRIFKTALGSEDSEGGGAFSASGRLHGIVNGRREFVCGARLAQLLNKKDSLASQLHTLRRKSDKVYPQLRNVQHMLVRTTMGNFCIRLHADVPEFADNFIRLATDGYYDSLLIHRVMPNFLIQTGAADSRHAAADDPVGWDGPGYTIATQPTPNHLHVRGAVAASKPPESKNPHNRSDGGQFYVVVGAKYSEAELNKMARDYHKTFSATQKRVYGSVGGAPHLDGDYTVFGEVSAGMDVVERIAAVELNGDRPQKDVRVLSIRVVGKK